MTRYTFVVQVHPDGISTLENLATRERLLIADLAAVGPQIGRWLQELRSGEAAAAPASVPEDHHGGGE